MRACPQCQNECDETHKFCPACGFPISKVARENDDPMVGRTLAGGYVILELVGIGGMGRVYRAEQTNLGRTVAVKIVHPHLVGEENAAARFITEARAASSLNHPNSVAVIDFGKTDEGELYLVMEFLRGKDLARVNYEEGPLSFRRIVKVLVQVLAALSEAHALGIIHRDLKPENIVIDRARQGGDFVKVVDFGLAKMRQERSAPGITSPGIVCGTPEYMSPEQGRGDPLDARSDLYAVGVILYQLLTGKLPFEAESPTQVVLMHISEAPLDPQRMAPERKIPASISDVCLMALAKDPAHRFIDADEFAATIADALAQVEAEAKMTRHVQMQTCPSCGVKNQISQKFCGDCGMSLRLGSAPTEAPLPLSPILSPLPQALTQSQLFHSPLPFLEREEDIAWALRTVLPEDAQTLKCALILGEPGSGKTRMLEEFARELLARGQFVAATRPDPFWAEVSYYAVRTAVRALAELPDGGGSARDWGAASAEARRGLAELFENKPAPMSSHAPPQSLPKLPPRERMFAVAEALRWALVRASEVRPGVRIVLLVDDFQSMDGPSRTAFLDAIREPPLVPSTIVISQTAGVDMGVSADVPQRILAGLSAGSVTHAMVGAGVTSPPAPIGRGLSPLYLDQVMRFTREYGGGAPARVADILAARIERIAPDARRVLQAVCVFGDQTPLGAIQNLLPEIPDLVVVLTALEATGMLRATDRAWSSAHPLIREVVLAMIPVTVRRALHDLALGLAEVTGAPLEVRAMHAFFAQNTFQALVLLEKVAICATEVGDVKGTIHALRRGLELARREMFRGQIEEPERAVLIFSRKLGEALTAERMFTDAEGVLREAMDLASIAEGPERARVLGALAQLAIGRGREQEAGQFITEALIWARRAGADALVSNLEALRKSLEP